MAFEPDIKSSDLNKSVVNNSSEKAQIQEDVCLSNVVVVTMFAVILFLAHNGVQLYICRTLVGRKYEQEEVILKNEKNDRKK